MNTIQLKLFNEKIIEVDENVIRLSLTVNDLLNCINNNDTPVPLPTIKVKTMKRIIKWCKHHLNDQANNNSNYNYDDDDNFKDKPIPEWDDRFLTMNQAALIDLIQAANFLNVNYLLQLACKKVALMIKDKSVDEIRLLFNIANDFTLEEEQKLRKDIKYSEDF